MKKVDVQISHNSTWTSTGHIDHQVLVVRPGAAVTFELMRKSDKLDIRDNYITLNISNNDTEDGKWQFAREDIVEFANSMIENFGYQIVANKTGEHITLFNLKEDKWV